MQFALERSVIRSWRPADAGSLAHHANNRKIWLNLRDAFPHPYSRADADAFIAKACALEPETLFAIDVDGAAVGGIGFVLQQDVERVGVELGYWLGEEFWGRGIVTEAVIAVTRHAIATHGLTRVFAMPFGWNIASCRVLEKAGFTREAVMRKNAIKDGRVIDSFLYAFVVED